MESSLDDSKKSFFKYVFNFDDDSKSEILNTMQYALLAIIPIIFLIKFISRYLPAADENKSSLEITGEVIIQIIILFVSLIIIHRIITFIPTYSKTKYPDISIIHIVLSTLFIMLSLQTIIGEKVNILIERIVELWEGKSSKKKSNGKNGKNGNLKVSQPISGQIITNPQMNNTAITQSLYTDGTAISALPLNEVSYGNENPQSSNMYKSNSSVANAGSQGDNEMTQPMAASEFLGGSFGSSW